MKFLLIGKNGEEKGFRSENFFSRTSFTMWEESIWDLVRGSSLGKTNKK